MRLIYGVGINPFLLFMVCNSLPIFFGKSLPNGKRFLLSVFINHFSFAIFFFWLRKIGNIGKNCFLIL